MDIDFSNLFLSFIPSFSIIFLYILHSRSFGSKLCLFANYCLVVGVDSMEHAISIKVLSVSRTPFLELHRAEIREHPSSE